MVQQAVAAGVTRLIAVGTNLERSANAVSLGHAYEEVWAGVGHHPLEPSEPDVGAVRQMAEDEMVVVIGEIGLDFEHVGGPPNDLQIARLNEFFALATDLDLPVSIHNRGAAHELLAAIHAHPGVRGAMHYFALDWEWAQRFLDVGFYLSFAGLITRPSRDALRDVVKRCPADRLLLETDSPYGNSQKRMGIPNRPAYLVDTAELVAELRGISVEQLADQERANAITLFQKMK
ncbi:MAG TPA: TatD family hydrolase [Candidatus Dormibacteraeota bacterium]|nr:TatD family hydrolase [Candidatus Dormibacteraeota bacterium]